MYTHSYLLQPLAFAIESDCADPMKALEQELKCGTPNEEMLLSYLNREIDDRPTLDGSITTCSSESGAFCYIPMQTDPQRAPIYYPIAM